MAYNSNIKLYCKCETVALINEITGAGLALSTPLISSDIVPSHDRSLAWQLTSGNHASLGFASLTAFTVGFWLKSSHPGLGVHAGSLVPLLMPVVAKANFSNNLTMTSGQFVIYEQTLNDGNNQLCCTIVGPSSSDTAYSPEYAPEQWNHFIVSYASGAVRMFINGVMQSVTSEFSSIPSSLASSSSSVSINEGVPGSSYDVAANTGIIDDVFVTTDTITSATVATRIFLLGPEYVYNSSLSNIQEITNISTFDDVSTISVNAILSDNSGLFIASSDGTVLRGNRNIWGTRCTFGSDSEIASLNQAYGIGNDSGQKYSITNGVLTTTNVVVRV
jgi:hypothetical protein